MCVRIFISVSEFFYFSDRYSHMFYVWIMWTLMALEMLQNTKINQQVMPKSNVKIKGKETL